MGRTTWLIRIGATLVLLAVAAAVAVHTPVVRRYALERVVRTISERYQLRLQADTLEYNLLALRVALTGVELSAVRTPAQPFFTAQRVTVSIPRSSVLGPFTLDTIDIHDGHVHVTRAADGSSNLPATTAGGGTPPELHVNAINAVRFGVDYSDTGSGISFELPSVDIAIRDGTGQVELRQRGHLARRRTTTSISELRGGVGFDGRNIALSRLALRTDEASVVNDGTIRLLVDEPGLDVRLEGRADAARVASWVDLADPPAGDVQFSGKVEGTFDALHAAFDVRSARLVTKDLAFTNIGTRVKASPDVVAIERLDASVANGTVSASGQFPIDSGNARFVSEWDGVDVDLLMRTFAPSVLPRPTGRTTGRLQAHGPLSASDQWTADARIDTVAGETTRDRIGLDGRADLHLENGRWQLTGRHYVDAVPLESQLGGKLNFDSVMRSSIGGKVVSPSTAIKTIAELLTRTDLVTADIPAVDGKAHVELEVGGTFDAPALTARGTATIGDAAPLAPGTPLRGTLDLTFDATMREVQVNVLLRDLAIRADATINPRRPYAASMVVEAPTLELDELFKGVATPVPIDGVVSATVDASGPLENWRAATATLHVAHLHARAGGLPVDLVSPGRIEYRDRTIDVTSLEMTAGDVHVSAAGLLPAFADGPPVNVANALRVTATGSLEQVREAVYATGAVELPDVTATGPAALLARLTGSAERPVVVADLELGPGTVQVPDLPPITGVQLRARADEQWIEVRELKGEWQDSRVEATGRVPAAWVARGASEAGANKARVEARLASVTTRVLAPFLDPETLAQIDGSLDASLRLESAAPTVDAVTGDIRLDRMDVRVANLPVEQRVPTRVTLADGFARVTAWQWAGQGGSVALAGQVRLADGQAAILANGNFDLRMLTPFVRNAGMATAGVFEPRLSITGTLDNPRIDGVADVSGAEIRVQDPQLVASGLSARAVFTRTSAQLTALNGTLNGGALRGTGSIDFAPRTPIETRLSFDANGVAIEFPEGLRSELNAALRIGVTIPAADVGEPTGSVTGTVTVVRSAYREPTAVVTGLLRTLRTRQAVAQTAAAPSLLDNLTLDVRVLTEEDLLVDNNLGRLQLGADLRVIGTMRAPALAGRADIREGGRLFFGRNIYVIDAGSSVDFSNPVVIEADVDIVAHTRAGGEDIRLTLKGTPDNLDPDLSAPNSNANYGEADLVSILLTGRPLDEVSGQEAQIVGEQVLGYLSGDVLGIASRAVGLDSIRLGGVDQELLRRDPTAIATEVDPTTRLTFGKSFGRSIDVTYSQDLRDGDAQAWIFDYRPFRRVEFRLVSDDDDLRSYEFRHDVTFGAERATRSDAAPAPARQRRDLKVTAVNLRGAIAIPERTVRSVLKVKPGQDFDIVEWQRDRERIEALYRREGYDEARVDVEREENGSSVVLTYTIASGPRTSIEVNGYELDRDTRGRIRSAWQQSVFEGFLVDEAAGIVKNAMTRDGYPQARVNVAFRLEPQGTKTMTIQVERGPRVEAPPATVAPTPVIDEVRFQGVSRLASDVVFSAASLTPGTPFDPAAVEQARQRVLALYRREAFQRVRVDLHEAPRGDPPRVVVTFLVEEGPRRVVTAVDVEGNRGIDRDVITRALALPANEPLGSDSWLQARRRVSDTGLFRRVDVTAVPAASVAPDDHVEPVRVRVAVEEWPALRLRYGFAVSEERPEGEVEGRELTPGVSADITRRTLFGRAVTTGAAINYTRRAQDGRVFVNAPTMFGWPIESTMVVERSREEFTAASLLTEVTDVSWEQRMRFMKNLRLSYAYHFERNHTFDTEPPSDPSLAFDIELAIARLNAAAAWDTRDTPVAASRGTFLSLSFDYAPEVLGSDIRFVRALGHAYRFLPWRRVVFASAARVGFARALDDQDLLFSERFIGGGGRTVRGAAEDSLGPQLLGEPLGGEALVILNEEVRFPIYRWVGGLGFIDAGNVFEKVSDFDLGNLVSSFGFGLRVNTPFAMLRVDWGRLFSPGANERSGRWSVGIGHAF